MSVFAQWLVLALTLAPAASWAGAPPEAAATAAQLATTLAESERLLQSLDGLREQLTIAARRAAENADLAVAYDERQRYEELARAAQARLAELEATRAELTREIAALREHVKNREREAAQKEK